MRALTTVRCNARGPAGLLLCFVALSLASCDGSEVAPEVFDPVEIRTQALPAGLVGTRYDQTLTAAGGDGAYSWRISEGALPPGLELTEAGGVTGTPTTPDSATFTAFVATGDRQTTKRSFTLIVHGVLEPVDAPLPPAVVGDPWSHTLAARGGDGRYTWSVEAGPLPAGLALAADGLITGAPESAGTADLTLRVESGDGQSATLTLRFAAWDALAVVQDTLPPGIVGVPYSSTLEGVGGDGAFTWTLVDGALPEGLALAADGSVEGIPASPGPTTFTVELASGDAQSDTATVVVAAWETLAADAGAQGNGVVGVAYSSMLTASGGDGSYAWALVGGALPDGITLDANGALSGTPTAPDTATAEVEVVSGDGQRSTHSVAIRVYPPLSITTASLPEATTDLPYTQTLAATGGDGSWSWSIVAGALPPGMTLDAGGGLSGTPTAAGAPSFTVRVESTDGQSAETALALKVRTPATFIEGYAGATSIDRGESIEIFVSTDGSEHRLEVYRAGWYGGDGQALMATVDSVPGLLQAVPDPDPVTGLVEAGWDATYTLQTDPAWTSGVYIVEVFATPDAWSRMIFVVRDDGNRGDMVVQIPVTTYQAYNGWGGKSLYEYNSPGGRAYQVSFDRPYDSWNGGGDFFAGDYGLIRWLEREGYTPTYITSLDMHTDPGVLSGVKVFVSNFHDEYWSRPMRDRLVAAQDAGTHTAFLDSNNIYWQVRFEPSADGRENRVMVSYKDASLDPLAGSQPDLATVRWREAPVNEPENAILGVMYESFWTWGDAFPWVVQNAAHWIYDGTGLTDGDEIPGLVGYEYDRVWNNGLTPAGLQVLAASPVVDIDGVAGIHNAAIFTRPSGAIVFSAGTNYWAWKLDDNDSVSAGEDARVQQMTRNLLNRMLTGG